MSLIGVEVDRAISRTKMIREMRESFQALWQRVGAPGSGIEIFRNLVEQYSAKHRSYHALTHIYHGLMELAKVPGEMIEDLDALELAWWFHDYIYEIIPDSQNEQSSALFAHSRARRMGFDGTRAQRVFDHIMATKHTGQKYHDHDTEILLDIDLSILAGSWLEYQRYELGIAREYQSGYTPEEYRGGRKAFLRSMLRRRHIYHTMHFRIKYGRFARNNIRQSLRTLVASG